MAQDEHVSEAEVAALRTAIEALTRAQEASTRANAVLTTNVAVLTESTRTLKETVEKMQASSVSKDAFDSVVVRLGKLESIVDRAIWLVISGVILAVLGFVLHANGTWP